MSDIDFSDTTLQCEDCKSIIVEFFNALRNKLKDLLPTNFVLEVTIVGSAEIKNLNYKYRGKDYVTDVLSFEDGEELPNGKVFLGSIIICLEKVIEQSKEIGNTFEEELRFLFMHGVLHLLGFDHEIDNGEMFEKQRELKKNLSSFFTNTEELDD